MFHTRQDFDQCRFAGPILAHQGVDLFFIEGKVHVLKGNHSWKGFINSFHIDDRLSLCHRVNLPFVVIAFARIWRMSKVEIDTGVGVLVCFGEEKWRWD
jgi:hypothetical protein